MTGDDRFFLLPHAESATTDRLRRQRTAKLGYARRIAVSPPSIPKVGLTRNGRVNSKFRHDALQKCGVHRFRKHSRAEITLPLPNSRRPTRSGVTAIRQFVMQDRRLNSVADDTNEIGSDSRITMNLSGTMHVK